nr:hypothetical protein [Tanacetum cinerariifolium]
MEEGRFLGYMVTTKRIRAGPEKIKFIVNKSSPDKPEQIESMCLKLLDPGRFLPKPSEIFRWTERAEKAIQKLKWEMGKLPTLFVLKGDETLMVCFLPKSETVSVVLFIERDELHVPIHYVNRPLQGMEMCYTPTEKVVLALIHTTRFVGSGVGNVPPLIHLKRSSIRAKDHHTFIDSKLVVDLVEGTREAREEKANMLKGLATIQLGYLNEEMSV